MNQKKPEQKPQHQTKPEQKDWRYEPFEDFVKKIDPAYKKK